LGQLPRLAAWGGRGSNQAALEGVSNQGLEFGPFLGWQRRIRLFAGADRKRSRHGFEMPSEAGGAGERGGARPRSSLGPIGHLHPGGNSGANLKSISHRCHPILVVFVWEFTKECVNLPLGWDLRHLQRQAGGVGRTRRSGAEIILV